MLNVIKNFMFGFAFLSITLMTACGGGGGSAGTVTSTETFQVRTALSNYLTNSATYTGTVSGSMSSNPVTGSFIVTQGSVAAATFEGQPALSKATTATGNIVINGTNVPSAVTVTSYFDSNYTPLGESGGTDYEVVTGSVSIPVTGKVGDTANLYTVNRYSTSSKTLLKGTTHVSYAIEPDTASTANLKLIEIEKDSSNVTTSTTTISFILTPAGGITRKQETFTQGSTGTAIVISY